MRTRTRAILLGLAAACLGMMSAAARADGTLDFTGVGRLRYLGLPSWQRQVLQHFQYTPPNVPGPVYWNGRYYRPPAAIDPRYQYTARRLWSPTSTSNTGSLFRR